MILILFVYCIFGETLLPFTDPTLLSNAAPKGISTPKNPQDCSFYLKPSMKSANAKIVLALGLFATFSPFITLIAAQNNQNLKTIINENAWLEVALVLSIISGIGLTVVSGSSVILDYLPVLKLTKEGIVGVQQLTPWDTVEMVREKKDKPFHSFSEKSFAQVLLHNGNLIKLYCNNNIVLDKDRSNPISAQQLVQLINQFLEAYSTQNHNICNNDAA